MSNEFINSTGHSAAYFGETRDYWWNDDFLRLMGQRWELSRVHSVLDVGCGIGHWGQVLAHILPEPAHVVGVDRDPVWVQRATERVKTTNLSGRYRYQAGLAEQLPFEDSCFDFVTCQTVLVHVPDPGLVLSEMIRVTKPGGLVVAVEPNNATSALLRESAASHENVGETVSLVKFQLVCERGKALLGEGNNSLGELLPGLFAARGLGQIEVYLNDKTNTLFPPYTSREQQALSEEIANLAHIDFWIWNRADTRRYFIAGGGDEGELELFWTAAIARERKTAAAIARSVYASAGGTVCYLVSGRKKSEAG